MVPKTDGNFEESLSAIVAFAKSVTQMTAENKAIFVAAAEAAVEKIRLERGVVQHSHHEFDEGSPWVEMDLFDRLLSSLKSGLLPEAMQLADMTDDLYLLFNAVGTCPSASAQKQTAVPAIAAAALLAWDNFTSYLNS